MQSCDQHMAECGMRQNRDAIRLLVLEYIQPFERDALTTFLGLDSRDHLWLKLRCREWWENKTRLEYWAKQRNAPQRVQFVHSRFQ